MYANANSSHSDKWFYLAVLVVLAIIAGLLLLIYRQPVTTPQPAVIVVTATPPAPAQVAPAADYSNWAPIPPIQENPDPNWQPSQPGEVQPVKMIPLP